jgi:hypothetical protein
MIAPFSARLIENDEQVAKIRLAAQLVQQLENTALQ